MNGPALGHWPDQPPRAHQLRAVILSLLDHTPLVLLDHAEEQMFERGIDLEDVIKVLRRGEIVGAITHGLGPNEWKCKVTCQPQYPENKRFVGVVTIVAAAAELLIKTVEWEDEA